MVRALQAYLDFCYIARCDVHDTNSNWVDVAGSLLTVLSRVLLALPLFLDMLGMNAMQLLYSRVHVQAWNLVEY